MPPEFTETDAELLSAYLDGMLTDSETAALEERLAIDPALRRELAALRQTVDLIHALPAMKAPRNFTLSPEMVAVPPAHIEPDPAMVLQKVVVMPVSPPKRRLRPRPWQASAFAAAAVFIVAIGLAIFFSVGGTANAPAPAAVGFGVTPTTPPFSNMVTGIQPEQGQDQQLPVPQPQGTVVNEELLRQATTTLSAAPTQGAPATAPADVQDVPDDGTVINDALILPEATGGMGGGGSQGSGDSYVPPANGNAAGSPYTEPKIDGELELNSAATSLTNNPVNPDPNAAGFTVRPASEAGETPIVSAAGAVPTSAPDTGIDAASETVPAATGSAAEIVPVAPPQALDSAVSADEQQEKVEGLAHDFLDVVNELLKALARVLSPGALP